MNLSSILLLLLVISCSCEVLNIKKQGMFSAGGTVLYSDGVFDVANYYTSRAGSSLHVDHANVFYQMPGGQIWGSAFFLFLLFAALSTVVAVFENLIAFMIDELHYSRLKAAVVNMIVITIFSLPCALGFNLLSGIHPLGGDSTILDLEDYIVSDILLPLGSFFVVIFCGVPAAWGWRNFFTEANTGKGMKLPTWTRYYFFTLLPLAILAIIITGTIKRWWP